MVWLSAWTASCWWHQLGLIKIISVCSWTIHQVWQELRLTVACPLAFFICSRTDLECVCSHLKPTFIGYIILRMFFWDSFSFIIPYCLWSFSFILFLYPCSPLFTFFILFLCSPSFIFKISSLFNVLLLSFCVVMSAGYFHTNPLHSS